MYKKVNVGSRQSIVVQNANPKGVDFHLHAYSDTVNERCDENLTDLEKVYIDAKLYQKGIQTTLYAGPLDFLLRRKSFYKNSYAYGVTSIEVTEAAAVKGVICQSFHWDFGTVINLDGEDKIVLDIKVDSDVNSGDGYFDSANSYMDVEFVEGVGEQFIIPFTEYRTIQAGEARLKLTLGDNVDGVLFLNKDITNSNVEDCPLESVNVKSDRLNATLTPQRLHLHRKESFVYPAENSKRNQTFMITEGELDECEIDFNFDAGAINVNKNFIIWDGFKVYKEIYQKGLRMRNKHSVAAQSKVV
jgi:hypothetical protein